MPRRKNNTLDKAYGPLEGVDSTHRGSPRLNSATIRQHGMSAPSNPKQEKPHTYSVREGVNILAEKFFGAKKEAAKPAAKQGKRKPAPKKRR